MHEFSKSILDGFQVRKSKKQKTEFLRLVQEHLKALDYDSIIQSSKTGMSRNLVVGNVEQAEVICTAHYDTCANMIVPNFITPMNMTIYLLYSCVIVVLIYIVVFALSFLLEFISGGALLMGMTSGPLCFLMLFLLIAGYPNKHNANDNTSGVITLLEIMERLPSEMRGKIAFVFFDNEEKGLLGSMAFVSEYKKVLRHQLIVNYDCVSDGDALYFKYNGRMNHAKEKAWFEESYAKEHKELLFTENGFYPSDQKSFDRICKTVGVCALKHSKRIGYYMNRIHTSKDVMFDEKNIELLADSMVKFINKEEGFIS